MNLSSRKLLEKIDEVGVENATFILSMRPVRTLGTVRYTSSSDELTKVECKIDESTYKVSERYKVTLRASDPRYGCESFYVGDLASLIGGGFIEMVGVDFSVHGKS